MNKKTDYPDLEKSENVSFWKHLLNWFWNKPRWIAEELYEKYFFTTKKELQKTKLELDMLIFKVEQLELAAEMRSVMEKADNVTNLFEERSNK
tara:strand:+ start:125 stop:403 length:279 start_codon:yes stop_codon:yes gene_type:complete